MSSSLGILEVECCGKGGEKGRYQTLKTACMDVVRLPEDRLVPQGLDRYVWGCSICSCEVWGQLQWCVRIAWKGELFCRLLHARPGLGPSARQSGVLMLSSPILQCISDSRGALKLEVWAVVWITVSLVSVFIEVIRRSHENALGLEWGLRFWISNTFLLLLTSWMVFQLSHPVGKWMVSEPKKPEFSLSFAASDLCPWEVTPPFKASISSSLSNSV